jgi:hypothetical protein
VPFMLSHANSPVARAVRQLAQSLTQAEPDPVPAPDSSTPAGGWRRFLANCFAN